MRKIKRTHIYLLKKFMYLIVVYFGVYLFVSFVNWRLDNPFIWISNLPKYSPADRFGVSTLTLIVLTIYTVASISGYQSAGRLDESERRIRD